MPQTVGTVQGSELWLRCPECGDSQHNPNKGHLSVNLDKGVYYCVRCSYSGVLTPKQSLEIASRYDRVFQPSTPLPLKQLEPQAATGRFSALERWHHVDDQQNTWDVFNIRDPRHNEVVGQYFRFDGASLIFGESGLGWVGSDRPISSATSPLRLVEGPYDVLGPQDLCCFGFLRSQALKLLEGQFVLLCPDGDVWEDELLRERMVKLIKWSLTGRRGPEVVGLEMIPDGKDPDECHPVDRLLVSRSELLRRFITRRSTFDLGRYV